MKFLGKELKDLIVTLPFADGTVLECGVFAYFELEGKEYFALLPYDADRKLDFSQSFMMYRVEEGEDKNPLILYIEDDAEYEAVANHFSKVYLQRA